ncbi:MAG TPA: MFS transporter [Acidimicrobiales bacterium]|jgi:EmrB/QacA subfamily drug resistance transporter|nr:MFS transporter [Acidimicrobiales bacterium]
MEGAQPPGGSSAGTASYVALRSAPGRWVLLATVLGSSLAAIDGTVVGIALPVIGRQFHVPLVSVQWVVTAYLLMLSSLLIVGGSLGDRFGRRRIFLIGVVWFAVASAACAAAPNSAVLIATRAVQGAGAALLVPASLAIVQAAYVEKDRARAIGAWSGLGGVATAAGPLVGGYLVTAASWRWIFLLNVPLAVIILATSRHVPESSDESAPPIDRPGAVLTIISLAGITYGLVEGAALGWMAAPVLAALCVGGVGAAALVVIELRSSHPILPVGLLRNRQLVAANACTLFVYASLSGALFLLPIQLEVGDHYTPFDAGLSLLPLTVVMLVLSSPSGALSARIGPRLQMTAGPVVVGAGLALLARAASGSSYPSVVLPAILVFAIGLGVTVAPLTATALGAVSDEHSGLASALNNDVARVGGLVAVAIIPAIAGLSGGAYLHAAPLAHGFRIAIFVTAGWCVIGGLAAAVGIRNPPAARRLRGPLRLRREPISCALDASPLVCARPLGAESGGPPDQSNQSDQSNEANEAVGG